MSTCLGDASGCNSKWLRHGTDDVDINWAYKEQRSELQSLRSTVVQLVGCVEELQSHMAMALAMLSSLTANKTAPDGDSVRSKDADALKQSQRLARMATQCMTDIGALAFPDSGKTQSPTQCTAPTPTEASCHQATAPATPMDAPKGQGSCFDQKSATTCVHQPALEAPKFSRSVRTPRVQTTGPPRYNTGSPSKALNPIENVMDVLPAPSALPGASQTSQSASIAGHTSCISSLGPGQDGKDDKERCGKLPCPVGRYENHSTEHSQFSKPAFGSPRKVIVAVEVLPSPEMTPRTLFDAQIPASTNGSSLARWMQVRSCGA
jgi:hypothetical protein